MPAYLYLCEICQKEWIDFHSFKERPEKCPNCSGCTFKKVYGYIGNTQKKIELSLKKKDSGKKVRDFIQESTQNLKEYKVEQKQ